MTSPLWFNHATRKTAEYGSTKSVNSTDIGNGIAAQGTLKANKSDMSPSSIVHRRLTPKSHQSPLLPPPIRKLIPEPLPPSPGDLLRPVSSSVGVRSSSSRGGNRRKPNKNSSAQSASPVIGSRPLVPPYPFPRASRLRTVGALVERETSREGEPVTKKTQPTPLISELTFKTSPMVRKPSPHPASTSSSRSSRRSSTSHISLKEAIDDGAEKFSLNALNQFVSRPSNDPDLDIPRIFHQVPALVETDMSTSQDQETLRSNLTVEDEEGLDDLAEEGIEPTAIYTLTPDEMERIEAWKVRVDSHREAKDLLDPDQSNGEPTEIGEGSTTVMDAETGQQQATEMMVHRLLAIYERTLARSFPGLQSHSAFTPHQPTPVSIPTEAVLDHEFNIITEAPFSPISSLPSRDEPQTVAPTPTADDSVSQSFAPVQSPRPYSPVVPPRIQQTPIPISHQRTSSNGSSNFTEDARGRSPTRRSWKAASQKSVPTQTRNNTFGIPESVTNSNPPLPSFDQALTRNPAFAAYHGASPLRSLVSTSLSHLTRPETVQTVASSQLFYNASGWIHPPSELIPPSTSASVYPEDTQDLASPPTHTIQSMNKSNGDSSTERKRPGSQTIENFPQVPFTPAEGQAPIPQSNDCGVNVLATPYGGSTVASPVAPILNSFPLPYTPGTVAGTVPAPSPSAVFRLTTLITNFLSDISYDRGCRPRWRQENHDLDQKIQEAYMTLHDDLMKTRIKFLPWNKQTPRVDLIPEVSALADELPSSAGSRDLYLDDIENSLKTSTPENVKLSLIRTVIDSWEELIITCLGRIRDMVDAEFVTIIQYHFTPYAQEELTNIVHNVTDAQIYALTEAVAGKIRDMLLMEYTRLFSPSASRSDAVPQFLEKYQLAADRAHQILMAQKSPSQQQPTPVGIYGEAIHSYIDNEVHEARPQSRHDSQAMNQVLDGLSRLGFGQIGPHQLYQKLGHPTIYTDIAAVTVMAEVDVYFNAVAARFIDYATLHIEHDLVHLLGERIKTILLQQLDISGEDIEERSARWLL